MKSTRTWSWSLSITLKNETSERDFIDKESREAILSNNGLTSGKTEAIFQVNGPERRNQLRTIALHQSDEEK